ncbi:phage holin family protein [Methylobacterium nonmethylotrophicum]|uniref:Phage holin family protein n=1 Tax=Methylobacterium nonmethylotrophicum TaxID=1141884 RepID=A0A4Z0NHM4_9HYPH|nr:phage holin family protein [Methylobacterium nonmethylotrophicum]TGD94958.1 phage holin family protein [Methylobacterium nonmethylotrophicum]
MSTIRMIAEAVRLASELAVKEIALFSGEVDRLARTVSAWALGIGTVVLLACVSGFLLLMAVVKGLGTLIGSEPLAAVIGAAPFVVAAALLTRWGLRSMELRR